MSGVKFGNYHTEDDWELIMTDIIIPEATPKTYNIDVPGRDGVIDLTEVLMSEVKFNNRLLRFEFILVDKGQAKWQTMYSRISNAIHGKVQRIIVDTDKGYYWKGRCLVSSEKKDGIYSRLIISVDAEPYKYDDSTMTGKWLWGTFSFRTGIILPSVIQVNGSKTLILDNDRKIVSPVFICSSPMELLFCGATYTLNSGTNTNSQIRLLEGNNQMEFRGNGAVTIQYMKGAL